MGYRYYLYAIPKKQVAEIQACKTDEDCLSYADRYGYDTWGGFSPYNVNKEIYELGKYSEIGDKLEWERPSLFTSEELMERYSGYCFAILKNEDFEAIIEDYRQRTANWFTNLLTPDNEENQLEALRHEAQYKLDEWSGKNLGVFPFNLDKNTDAITTSWSYEYAIFELVRLYKSFDWENDDLVLIGW